MEVNEGGTRALFQAARGMRGLEAVLVSGSAEVYGAPKAEDLPLTEKAPIQPRGDYGKSKLAQERVALLLGAEAEIPTIVTRSFNHTGPGQRLEFVAPAMVARVLQAKRSGDPEIVVGNLDVRRDFSDVRDVVRAYRLLIESCTSGATPANGVVNVGAGESVSIREILDAIARQIGVAVTPKVDPTLVRPDEATEIAADVSVLRRLTGWRRQFTLQETLRDLVGSMAETSR
jgi:GDP-4-dehydro-6-deoxy-D-mannose reductase